MKNRLRYLPYVFLLALLPVMVLRDFTPSNELRYLSIADEALRDGHLFAFTNQGEPYADKPPLYLWIVMLGKMLFGGHRMWFLALFSFVPAIVILRTMDRWVRSSLDERARLCGAMMLMTCGLFLGLAVFLRMDMLMCMFITLALHTFWRIYSSPDGGSSRDRTLFPVFVFAALFTKGPVGVLVPLLSTVAFLAVAGRLRTLGRYWGLRTWAILAAGCALWFFMVWRDGGTEYLDNLLFHQTIDRAVDAFHHKAPVYYYLVTMWYSLAPWSLLMACVWGTAVVGRIALTDLDKFFLTIILSTLVMLSAFSSKIAVYLAPTFPFFVYATLLAASRIRRNGWITAAVAVPAVLWCAGLAGVIVAGYAFDVALVRNGWCVAAGGALSVSGVWALMRLRRGYFPYESINILAAGLLAAVFVGGFALPRMNDEIGYGNLCRAAEEVSAEKGLSGYYVWRMHRPESMDVYFGEDVVQVDTDEVVAGRCDDGVLILPERRLERDDEMRRFVAGREVRRVGGYMVIGME